MTMHVIAKTKFTEAAKLYPICKLAIMSTYKTLIKIKPRDLHELQQVFPSAERFKYLDNAYNINIGGNKIRLIAVIFFRGQKLYVKHVVSHSDYDELTDKYRRGK